MASGWERTYIVFTINANLLNSFKIHFVKLYFLRQILVLLFDVMLWGSVRLSTVKLSVLLFTKTLRFQMADDWGPMDITIMPPVSKHSEKSSHSERKQKHSASSQHTPKQGKDNYSSPPNSFKSEPKIDSSYSSPQTKAETQSLGKSNASQMDTEPLVNESSLTHQISFSREHDKPLLQGEDIALEALLTRNDDVAKQPSPPRNQTEAAKPETQDLGEVSGESGAGSAQKALNRVQSLDATLKAQGD